MVWRVGRCSVGRMGGQEGAHEQRGMAEEMGGLGVHCAGDVGVRGWIGVGACSGDEGDALCKGEGVEVAEVVDEAEELRAVEVLELEVAVELAGEELLERDDAGVAQGAVDLAVGVALQVRQVQGVEGGRGDGRRGVL